MKKLTLMALFSVILLTLSANPITQKQAMRKAQAFVGSRMKSANLPVRLAYQSEAKKNGTDLFIYNVGQKKGFVIVSGDDATESILGYVDDGEFDLAAMPENMLGWLKASEEFVQLRKSSVLSPAKAAFHPTTVVEPLITTKWGQRSPYNSLTPTVYGIKTPTGCTATALAQVLRYHRYPVEACQTIPAYTTRTSKINMPELEPTTFDWDNMPDEVYDSSPQECIDAVSKLMLYCGQAHDMNYMSTGSGAYTDIIPERLPTYFGYANTMHYVYRRSYSEQEWDSLLVKELVNKRPVIYTAYNNISQGHTFICDGYDGKGLYHINWGWNGVGNGYFRITEAFATDEGLNDNIKNYHLSISQTAILGLQPSGEDDYVAPTQIFRAFTRPSLKNGRDYTRETVDDNFTNITFKQSFSNTTSASKRLQYGMALCDENDQVLQLLGSATATVTVGTPKAFEITDCALGAGLADGHYTIKAVYKRSSKADWHVMDGTDKNYINVVVDGLSLTLTPVPKADFVVNDIRMEKNYVVLELDNPDEEFYGPLYIRRYTPSTEKITQVSYDYVSFDPQTSEQFDIYVDESKKMDIYNDIYYLSVDEYDTQYFYCSLSNASIDMAKSFEILNQGDDPLSSVGDRIMLRLTLENLSTEPYNNYVTTELVDAGGTVVHTINEVVELPGGEKTTYDYELPVTDYGQNYVIRTTHKKNLHTWETDSIHPITVSEGAIYWTVDGSIKTLPYAKNLKVPEEAVAINVRGAYQSNVTANSNPNTVYMLKTQVPKGLTGKNYVNASNKGTQLHLTDGYDYFFPCEMTFSGAVTYTRDIQEDDSLRWDALTLPFTPEAVMVEEDTIQWYQDEEDTEASFWLMQFDGIENDTISTQFVQELAADTPYLMATTQQLAGKSMVFTANKVTFEPTRQRERIVVSGDTILHGTYCTVQQPGCYLLNDGTFVYSEAGEDVAAFRAYLTMTGEWEEQPQSLVVSPVLKKEEETPGPNPVLLGDVNADGVVNITDVMLLVNYIVGQVPSTFVAENADVDGNSIHNITDVMMIVNLVIGGDQEQNQDPGTEDDANPDDNVDPDQPSDSDGNSDQPSNSDDESI